jgi:hypothetical protein
MTQLKLMTLAVKFACNRIGMEWSMKHRQLTVPKISAVGVSA